MYIITPYSQLCRYCQGICKGRFRPFFMVVTVSASGIFSCFFVRSRCFVNNGPKTYLSVFRRSSAKQDDFFSSLHRKQFLFIGVFMLSKMISRFYKKVCLFAGLFVYRLVTQIHLSAENPPQCWESTHYGRRCRPSFQHQPPNRPGKPPTGRTILSVIEWIKKQCCCCYFCCYCC